MQNKTKRILAIAGIVILAGLILATLLLAIFGNESTRPWFMACICATIIVPIMLWVYSWLYNRLKSDVAEEAKKAEEAKEKDSDIP